MRKGKRERGKHTTQTKSLRRDGQGKAPSGEEMLTVFFSFSFFREVYRRGARVGLFICWFSQVKGRRPLLPSLSLGGLFALKGAKTAESTCPLFHSLYDYRHARLTSIIPIKLSSFISGNQEPTHSLIARWRLWYSVLLSQRRKRLAHNSLNRKESIIHQATNRILTSQKRDRRIGGCKKNSAE